MSGTIKSAYLHQTGSRAILPFAGCPLCTLASASGSAKPRGFFLAVVPHIIPQVYKSVYISGTNQQGAAAEVGYVSVPYGPLIEPDLLVLVGLPLSPGSGRPFRSASLEEKGISRRH